jgi:hypothetical protein
MDPAGVSLRSFIYVPLVAGSVAAVRSAADYISTSDLSKNLSELSDVGDIKGKALQVSDGISLQTTIPVDAEPEVATLMTSLVGGEVKGALGSAWADPSKLRTTVSLVIGSKMAEVCSQCCIFQVLLAPANLPNFLYADLSWIARSGNADNVAGW